MTQSYRMDTIKVLSLFLKTQHPLEEMELATRFYPSTILNLVPDLKRLV